MAQANVGDPAFLEEVVADDVLSALLSAALDLPNHDVDVRKVMSGLSDLSLIGSDDTADLGALLLERLDNERGSTAPH